MGILEERVKLSLLVNGNGLADNYKNNCLYLMDKITKSDDEYKAINVSDIKSGGFYFIQYKDKSTWMQWSPVFIVNWKKFDNRIILFGVNLNFIPIELRISIFDPYFIEEFFENDTFLKVDYNGMYNELLKWGFEYSLIEYNAIQVTMVHKINMYNVPRFLVSGHPLTKYNPDKLIQIWSKKIETREKRHNEMMTALVSDFYNLNKEIDSKYSALKKHILRIQNSLKNF
jgi:hypothetical protein